MGTKPEELKRDIDTTRAQLGEDLDQLIERISPGRVAARKAEDAKTAAASLAARVSTTTNDLKPKVAEGAQKAKESASEAARTTSEKAKANPGAARGLAAAAVAFGMLLFVRRRLQRRRQRRLAVR